MANEAVHLGKMPVGLVIMKYAYAFVALLSAFSAVFLNPESKVIFCGMALDHLPSVLINSILVLLPLLLYFGFSKPTITIWYLAFMYHVFFIGNSFLGILSIILPQNQITPMLEITGKSIYAPASGSESKILLSMNLFSVFNITMLIGVFILWYLWQKKEYFMPKSFLKNI